MLRWGNEMTKKMLSILVVLFVVAVAQFDAVAQVKPQVLFGYDYVGGGYGSLDKWRSTGTNIPSRQPLVSGSTAYISNLANGLSVYVYDQTSDSIESTSYPYTVIRPDDAPSLGRWKLSFPYGDPAGALHDAVTLSGALSASLLGITEQQLDLPTQLSNIVYAGPASGGAAVPGFRALVSADIPNLISHTFSTSMFFSNGLTVRPSLTTSGNSYIFQAYDNDGAYYTNMLSIANGNNPTATLLGTWNFEGATLNLGPLFFADQDVSPSVVGRLVYDNTVTGLDDGAFCWYDDDEIRYFIDLDSSETLGSDDDGKLVKYTWNSGLGYFSLTSGGGSMVYPGAGVAVSTGGAWGTSITLGTGVATALAANVGSAGAPVLYNGACGTPSAIALTNGSGLPISTGVSGLGTGVATALGNTIGAVGGVSATTASGTATLGTSAIASGASATVVTVSAANVATTDVINWGFNSDPTGVTGYVPSANGMLTIIAYPTAGNVNFKVCNNTNASITPGAITLNWRVNR